MRLPLSVARSQVIRSPDQVAVVVLNTNAGGYSNLVCPQPGLDRVRFKEILPQPIILTPPLFSVPALQVCHTYVTSRHWTFKPATLGSLTLHLETAPGVAGLSNWTEVVNGKAQQPDGVTVTTQGTDVSFGRMELDDKVPIRIFIASVQADHL